MSDAIDEFFEEQERFIEATALATYIQMIPLTVTELDAMSGAEFWEMVEAGARVRASSPEVRAVARKMLIAGETLASVLDTPIGAIGVDICDEGYVTADPTDSIRDVLCDLVLSTLYAQLEELSDDHAQVLYGLAGGTKIIDDEFVRLATTLGHVIEEVGAAYKDGR